MSAFLMFTIIVEMLFSMGNDNIAEPEIGTAITQKVIDVTTEHTDEEILEIFDNYDIDMVTFDGESAEFWLINESKSAEYVLILPTPEIDETWKKVTEKSLSSDKNVVFTIWTDGKNYSVTAIG